VSLVVYEIAKLDLLKKIYDDLTPLFGPTVLVPWSHTDSLLCSCICSDEEFIKKLKSISHLLDGSNFFLETIFSTLPFGFGGGHQAPSN